MLMLTLIIVAAGLVTASVALARDYRIRIINHYAHYSRAGIHRIERTIQRDYPHVRFLTWRQAYGKTYAQVWPLWLETRVQRIRWEGPSRPIVVCHTSYWPDSISPWPYCAIQVDRASFTRTLARVERGATLMIRQEKSLGPRR